MAPRRRRTLASVDRSREIVEARTRRESFAAIGARFGISPQRAHAIYHTTLRELPSSAVAEHRAALTDLADLAISELIAIAADPTVSARSRVEAWSAARGWSAEIAKLHGTYADRGLVVRADHEISPELERRLEAARRALSGDDDGVYEGDQWHEAVARRVLELQAGSSA